MNQAKLILFVALGVFALGYLVRWFLAVRRTGATWREAMPSPFEIGLGFVTNFFDTLGIGSFAPTTSVFKMARMVPDEHIPGTLNVGHTPPTLAQALIFIAIVEVEMPTLVAMIAAAVAGAWLGAGIVAGWPRRYVQIGMGAALLVAASLFAMKNLDYFPGGGLALGLADGLFWAGVAGNFALGALMTLGIGLYAPCMILVSLLGMNPTAAFPIMMGSCAFLMPVASVRFIEKKSYELRPALGLGLGGVPAVLIAAFIVKSLPLTTLRWGVVLVVTYAAAMMLRSAMLEGQGAPASRPLAEPPA